MLVLSRKRDEKILMEIEGYSQPIEITVVKIDKKNVRLGIEADARITVLRSELKTPPLPHPYSKVCKKEEDSNYFDN